MVDVPPADVSPEISFNFASDRYGFRLEAAGDIESSRAVINAMDRWASALDSLFGDAATALEDAAEAGIFPQHPAWRTIDDMRSAAKTQLVLVEDALAEVSRASAIVERARERLGGRGQTNPGTPKKTRGGKETVDALKRGLENAEQDLQRAEQARAQIELQLDTTIEDLRLYLGRTYEWSAAFHSGVCAAVLASVGAVSNRVLDRAEREFKRARPLGLKAVAAVFGLGQSTDSSADNTVTRLSSLWPKSRSEKAPSQPEPSTSPAGTPVPDELAWVIHASELLTAHPQSFGSFEEEPTRMNAWLDLLAKDVESLTNKLSTLAMQSLWPKIEDSYWLQWQWPPTGAVTRSSGVSVLDLIYTARHGSIPVVPTRGGFLSICQWSRIFDLSKLPGHNVPSHVLSAAAANLDIPQIADESANTVRLETPVALIRPLSSNTPAWTWTPQRDVKALGLMPRDVAEADRRAAETGAGAEGESVPRSEVNALELSQGVTEGARSTSETGTSDASDAVARADTDDSIVELMGSMKLLPFPVEALEFVEMRSDTTAAAAVQHSSLRGAAARVHFSYRATAPDAAPYVANPRDVRDLIDKTRSAYPHLFPVAPPPRRLLDVRILIPWLRDALRSSMHRWRVYFRLRIDRIRELPRRIARRSAKARERAAAREREPAA